MPHPNYFQTCQTAILMWSLVVGALGAMPRQERTVQSQSPSPSIAQLRADYVRHFLEPASHMALAKYFHDKGNRLQAFYILESARRNRFEEKDFDEAFALGFRGTPPHDHSEAAEMALLNEHTRNPTSTDTIVKLADIYISREDWSRAKEYLTKAIQLQPEDFETTQALAEVLSREDKQEESDRLLREYSQKYSQTLDGYQLRIAEVHEKNPAQAKWLLAEAIKKFPQEGSFVFYLGTIQQREGKLREAEEHLVKAAAMSPNSVLIQAWVGRFFFRVKNDHRRAMDYYLNAYLLDPHAYETEFVESRIPVLNAVVAKADYEQLRKSGAPLKKILEDPNPGVVYMALEDLSAKWDPSYLQLLLDVMGHDESGVRWYAMELIKKRVDRSFDATLKALLKDSDLRKRGLAAYIAVHLWKQESFGLMRSWLNEESQLLRFDAVSVLIMEAGVEGRAIVSEHLPRESHPRLKKAIASALKSGEPE